MITIDVSAAVHARAGLGRYSEELARNLLAIDPTRFDLFFNQGKEGKMPASLAGHPHRKVQWGYKPWRMAILMAQIANIGFNRLHPHTQLYHSTEHLLMPLRGVPTVLTMHDLIFKLFPEYHKKLNYWYLNWAVPIFCKNATAIIAISESTKQDLITHYGTPPTKIHVIPEAAADHFQPPTPDMVAHVKRKLNLPEQYLLHVSTIEPRKNLFRLVDALKILRQDFPNLKLLLAGAKGWLMDDFFAKIEQEGLKNDVVALGWVEDAEMPALIHSATLAVQPSLYEGFGLPILEHMACGQAVAASNTSSLPEVGGQTAIYFDPTNTQDIAQTIHQLLSNPTELHHRRQLGIQQAQKFSWQRTAAETLALYEKLLKK